MSEKPPLTTEAGTPVIGASEVTSAHVPRWTRMEKFTRVGKRPDLFLRFSTVAGFKGFADTPRDPRG